MPAFCKQRLVKPWAPFPSEVQLLCQTALLILLKSGCDTWLTWNYVIQKHEISYSLLFKSTNLGIFIFLNKQYYRPAADQSYVQDIYKTLYQLLSTSVCGAPNQDRASVSFSCVCTCSMKDRKSCQLLHLGLKLQSQEICQGSQSSGRTGN